MDQSRRTNQPDYQETRTTDECTALSGPSSVKNTLGDSAALIDSDNLQQVEAGTMASSEEQTIVGTSEGAGVTGVLGAPATDFVENVKPLPGWRYGLLGLGVCLGLFLAMLDTTIVATCLYSIAAEFGSLESINWVALAYTLAYLGCAVMFARISDVIGRKATFLFSFMIFIAFSLGCGFAQSLNQLVACRALQGLGGSGLYSIAIIIFPELTPANKKKFIASIIGGVIAIAGLLGPVIAGVLLRRSWRWVFWINVPIGVFSAVVFWFTWPSESYMPDIERRRWAHLDYLGSILLVAASVLICFAFQNAGLDATLWSQAIFIAPLVFGVFSIFCLFAWEFFIEKHWEGRKAAALPLSLLRNHVYRAGVLNTMFLGFPYFMCIYSFPIRFQVVHRKSALEAGLMLLPMLVASAVGSSVAGAISNKKNRIFETMIAACLFMLLGCALEMMATPSEDYEPKVLGFLAFIGFGFGLSASASTILGATEAPIWEHAPAQGIIAQLRILGGSIGIATSSVILGVKTRAQLTGVLTPEQMRGLAAVESSLTPAQYAAVRNAYTDALKEHMMVCCVILAVGFFLTLGVYRKNRVSMQEQQQQRVLEERQRRQATVAHVLKGGGAEGSA